MRELFKYVKSDKIIKLGMTSAVILFVTQLVYLGIVYLSLPPFLPLFNQLPWGDARLGTRLEIFLPVMIACIFSLANLFFLNKVYDRAPLVSRLLSVTTVLIVALSFIFVVQTVHIIL